MLGGRSTVIVIRDIDAWCKGLQTGLDLREFGQPKLFCSNNENEDI